MKNEDLIQKLRGFLKTDIAHPKGTEILLMVISSENGNVQCTNLNRNFTYQEEYLELVVEREELYYFVHSKLAEKGIKPGKEAQHD